MTTLVPIAVDDLVDNDDLSHLELEVIGEEV